MKDSIENKLVEQYQEIPRLTFLVTEQALKKQLIAYAEELSESLLVASHKYTKYQYREDRQALAARAELAELLGYFNNYLNCEGYSRELAAMNKSELYKHISYLCDALQGLGENFSHVIYNAKRPVEYFIKNLDHAVLGEMLLLVWKYTNEYVRQKVVNYLEEKMDIKFDIDAPVATGSTVLHDNRLEHHLNRELSRADKEKDVVKGALILAHELHHSGDPATALKEEIMASLATMKMLQQIMNDLQYEPDDINIKAQWETFNVLGEERFVTALEARYKESNFPVLETDRSVLRAYYEQQFGFIKYFVPVTDYDAFLLKYITGHPWAYLQYGAGQLVGLVVGVGKGLWNTVIALIDLVKMIVMLLVELAKLAGKAIPRIPETLWDMLQFIWSVIKLLGSEIAQHVTDFDKALQEDLEFLQDTAAIAAAFVDFIKEAPAVISELFVALKDFCYEEICKVVRDWARRNPYDEGYQLGEILGIVVFEIVIAIIGTKGVDKLAKAAKTGKLALVFSRLKLDKVLRAVEKLKRFQQKLMALLKAKGAFSVMKFLDKADDLADTVKYIKQSKQVVRIIEKFDNVDEAAGAVRALKGLSSLDDAVRLLERCDNVDDGYQFLRKLQGAPKEQAEEIIRIFNTIKEPEIFKDSVNIFNGSRSVDDFLKNINIYTKIDTSVGLEDYVKTGKLTEEFIAEVFKKYERDCAKDIDKIANLLKTRKGVTRTPEEMAALLRGGAPPPKVVARVGMKRYKSFSHRDLAWVNDPAELQGLSNTDLLKRLGWTKDEIDKILALPVEKRPGIVITLIEDPGTLHVPTWDVIRTETRKLLKSDKDFIRRLKAQNIDTDKVESYFDVLKRTSINDYDKLPDEVKLFRQALEKSFGNNPLFSGKGFTVTPDGKFGLREWFLTAPDVGFDLNTMQTAGFNVRTVVLGWE